MGSTTSKPAKFGTKETKLPIPTPKAKAKKEIAEFPSQEVAGFGDHVVKLTDKETGEVVCYIGKTEGAEKVYFGRPISLELFADVAEFLQKKKIHKLISQDDFTKAQSYADRKF